MSICLRAVVLITVVALMTHLSGSSASAQSDASWKQARDELIEFIAEGVANPRVLAAVRATERHRFVPADQRRNAYFDMALPIGNGVTISPPRVVAFMTEQLDPQPADRVLEIGTGSGYQAAVLSPLVADVFTIEIIPQVGQTAAERLQQLGYQNVHVRVGDGFAGWPEAPPFDKIIVTCSPEEIPQPLIEQLAEGGKMIIPLGERFQQSLCLVTKRGEKLERKVLESTFFIPMTGRAEELRVVAPSGSPGLVNGSFEETISDGIPAGWYYLRQARLVRHQASLEGESYLHLENDSVDRAAQALQAFALDGRKYRRLEIVAQVQHDLVLLTRVGVHAGIEVRFYNAERVQVGGRRIGPWTGSASWTEKMSTLNVPPETRLAVIGLGLFGALGRMDFDAIEVRAD